MKNIFIKNLINEIVSGDNILYHGSPKKFVKFSINNVGAGEGNQSFGYGLYFTSVKDIAEYYAKTLSDDSGGYIFSITLKNNNFIDFYKKPSNENNNRIITGLIDMNIKELPIKQLLVKNKIETKLDSVENAIKNFPNVKFLMESLKLLLGNDKEVSNFLNKVGIDGIFYSTDSLSHNNKNNVSGVNYVVFNDNNILIKDIEHIEKSDVIKEEHIYDKLNKLEKWFKEKQAEIDKIENYKVWKFKTNKLFKFYYNKTNELTKNETDPMALKGDINKNFIYHYTDGESFKNIIEDNAMETGGEGVSFSSNSNLYKRGFVFWHGGEYSEGRNHNNTGIKIKLNMNLMKGDGYKFRIGGEGMGTHDGEEELRLKVDEIPNISKYIKEVIIFKNKEKNYDEIASLLTDKNIPFKLI